MIIYKTSNLLNGKIYVGQDSKNNPSYYGSGKYLNRSIKKYGKENFRKEILCECSSKEELDEKEKFWIKELNCKVPNGYNIKDGGEGLFNPSEETRLKLRAPRGPMSEESKKNIKLACNRPEVKQKHRGPMSEEGKRNCKIAANKPENLEKHKKPRKPHSVETRLNMKIAANKPENLERLRKSWSEEDKRKLRKPHRPMSKEFRLNMSGEKNWKSREVICVETNQIFKTITSGNLWIKRGSISSCLGDRQKTAGGYHWKYVEEIRND